MLLLGWINAVKVNAIKEIIMSYDFKTTVLLDTSP